MNFVAKHRCIKKIYGGSSSFSQDARFTLVLRSRPDLWSLSPGCLFEGSEGVDHMKKYLFVIGMILAAASSAFSQKNKNGDSAPAINANSSVQAALQNSVDVRSAKVGDQIVLKTTQAIKQNGRTVVARGSELIGHITEVARRSKQNGESRIGMVFDRLKGNDLSTPITATIVSITQAHAGGGADDLGSADVMGSSSGSGRVSSGGNSGEGGLLGGGGGLLGGTTNAVGNIVNTSASTVGGVATTAAGAVGNTTRSLGGTLSGIQISSSASASANGSSTLSSRNQDIRLEKGVTFDLLVSGSIDK